MNRRLLAIALVVALAVVFVACGDESRTELGDSTAIKKTIDAFYSAYNAENWDICLTYVDDEYDAGEAIIALLKESKAATGDVTVNSIDNVNITGSTATVDVTATLRGKTETREHHLVKNDGNWLVSLEQ